MDRNKPRTSAAIRLMWIVAIACVSRASLATENSLVAPDESTLRIAQAADTPAVSPDQIIEWDMPRLPLREALAEFSNKTRAQLTVTFDNADALVGPIRGTFTPREVFKRLMAETCMDGRIYSDRTYRGDPIIVPGLNDVVREYNLPRSYLPDMVNLLAKASGDLLIAFLSYNEQDDKTMVGPVVGRMTLHAALRAMLADAPNYTYRWVDQEMVSVEARASVRPEQDMLSRSALGQLCRIRIPPTSDRMLVSASRLPLLGPESQPTVIDRRRIEQIGASSIAEVLQYLPQTAFTRAPGYRLSGAQYAEGRGVGPAMVLIENTRTMASANSLSDSAFDLNTIPLSAVERIEFIADAGSVVYGVDSVGGIVNIVLRQPHDGMGVEGRYGGARGGAIERRATALARTPRASPDSGQVTLIADHLEVTDLLGETRSRFANQDYRRYGGPDRRSLASAPGNFRSLDGSNLPGFDTPVVGLPAAGWGDSFDAGDLSSEPNLTSLLRYQSVAPARTRTSIVGTGTMPLGMFHLSGNVLATRQTTQYTLTPSPIQGFPLAADHPQNPLEVPVLYFGLLTGIPSQQYETRSELFRGTSTIGTRISDWDFALSVVHARESFDTQIMHVTDPLQVAEALNTNTLNILAANPGAGMGNLLGPRVTQRAIANASQVHLLGERAFALLPAGDLRMQFGAEWRREDIDIEEVDDASKRNATAAFLNMRIPLVHSFELNAGARLDHYSDSDSVTSGQYGFKWSPTRFLKIYGDYGQRFQPPSLYQLHLRPIAVDAPVLDPKTNQMTVATIVVGGQRNLDPTTATSTRIGFGLTISDHWDASVDYWQVDVEDRIQTLPLAATLAHEDYLPGRVTRGPPPADNLSGPIQTIDLSSQNLGELRAAGIDFNVRGEIAAGSGKLVSELGLTLNRRYSFRELPLEVGPFIDRVGVASEQGTIPKYRAIGTLTWDTEMWGVTANMRHHPKYRDATAGIPSHSDVSAQTVVDLNVKRRLGNSRIVLGAINIFDSEPDYSNVGVWGYDTSQGDLRGRFLYGELKVEF